MPLPRTFRVRIPPKPDTSTKPFHPETLGNTSVSKVGAPSPIANAALIARSKTYPDELATLVGSDIVSLREFLLSEIIPPALAIYNGAEDAKDVVASALEADPHLEALLASADSYLQFGLKLKLLRKICGLLRLGDQEAALLFTRALGSELNITDLNSVQGLLAQVAALQTSVQVPATSPKQVRATRRLRSPKTPTVARRQTRKVVRNGRS